MVSSIEVDNQLKRIGASFRYWGNQEKNELKNILIPGEQITACLNGRYEGGFAMLTSTNQRLLLIDKKPMFLTFEDIRFDMIAEIDFAYRLMDATISVRTPTRSLHFTAFRQKDLRKLVTNVQGRVMELRQHALSALSAPAIPTNPGLPELTTSIPQQINLPTQSNNTLDQFKLQYEHPKENGNLTPNRTVQAVKSLSHHVTNPYTKVPFMMRRRISRFYGN